MFWVDIARLNEPELVRLRRELVGQVNAVDRQLEMIERTRQRQRRRENLPSKAEIRRAQRMLRIIEIMRLARLGYDNRAIAGRLGLHHVSVSRIIQRELRAARYAENQARDHVPEGVDYEAWRLDRLIAEYRVRWWD